MLNQICNDNSKDITTKLDIFLSYLKKKRFIQSVTEACQRVFVPLLAYDLVLDIENHETYLKYKKKNEKLNEIKQSVMNDINVLFKDNSQEIEDFLKKLRKNRLFT